MKCKQLFAVAVLGSAMLFGCGDECKNPESTYALGGQVYAPAERSSDFNVRKGILVGEEAVGALELHSYRPFEYIPPNRYKVECRTEGTDHLFEFFISKIFPDGGDELIGLNNGSPSESYRTSAMGADELEGVVGVTCGIQIPERWECDSFGCWLAQEREHFGTVEAVLDDRGVECFDWYYEDMYHQNSR